MLMNYFMYAATIQCRSVEVTFLIVMHSRLIDQYTVQNISLINRCCTFTSKRNSRFNGILLDQFVKYYISCDTRTSRFNSTLHRTIVATNHM
jgi:hypothetical protein